MNETLITFLYELANFVVFALLLGWIFVKPIRRLLNEQAAKDARLEQTAQQHLAAAAQLRQQLLDDRQELSLEIEQQRQAMVLEAKQEAADLLQRASQTIVAQREHLSREVLQLQQAQLKKLADIMASSTRLAVESLLQQINGPPLEKALIDSACRQLKQIPTTGDETITVISAADIDENSRKQIAVAAGRDAVGEKVQYRLDQGLLGGIRIRTSRGVIDHSIAALSAFAEQHIQSQLTQTT